MIDNSETISRWCQRPFYTPRARRNELPSASSISIFTYSLLHRGAEDSASGYRSLICTSTCIPAASRNTTCLAQFIVHWLQSERGEEGKNFAALRFYCTVTLAVYPSDLCIREHLSKRAVISPVAISTSSSALSLIYTTKDERRNDGERRGLISIAAGVSRIRYARVWTRRKRRACQHPISGKRFVCRP